jgi:hypothetical protein
MMTSTQYRVTTWPLVRLPVPAVACFPVALEYGAISVDWEAKGAEGESWPEPPDEFYLRELRELDLEDEAALAGFVYRHGWFCRPNWQSLPVRFTCVGGLVQRLPAEVQSGLPDSYVHDPEQLGELHPYLAGVDALISGIAAYRAQKPTFLWESTGAHRGFIHIGELRVHAEFLRNAVHVWDALSSGHGLEELAGSWEGVFGLPQLLAQGWELETAAQTFLEETLNAALAEFHARVRVGVLGDGPVDPEVTLYEAMALQLFNDIAERTPYQHCARCGQPFLRQRGRAKFGQHRRIGTMYCSERCANAQKQQAYRDRRRAEKLTETDG